MKKRSNYPRLILYISDRAEKDPEDGMSSRCHLPWLPSSCWLARIFAICGPKCRAQVEMEVTDCLFSTEVWGYGLTFK
jgi:hypothetical protein